MTVRSPAEHREDPDAAAENLAMAVRSACVDAALRAYENARLSGLCEEGAWEAAVGAIRSVDIAETIRRASSNDESET